MGNTLSCVPLRSKKGRRDNDNVRRQLRKIFKRSKTKDEHESKLGSKVTAIVDREIDEEWELVDIDDSDNTGRIFSANEGVPSQRKREASYCLLTPPGSDGVYLTDIEDDSFNLTVTNEKFPSPRRLVTPQCGINSPNTPESPSRVEDKTPCLSVTSNYVTSPVSFFLSPILTNSPRSQRRTSHTDDAVSRIEDDDDKNSDTGEIIGSGDHCGFEEDEVNNDTTPVSEVNRTGDIQVGDSYNVFNVNEVDEVVAQPSVQPSDLQLASPHNKTDIDGGHDTTQMNADIADLFELILDRVEAAYAYREVSDDEDEGTLTPPLIEGDIYRGAGILKTTLFGDKSAEIRRITWDDDVKPPARDGPDLDPITAAFARERSNLLLKRSLEQKERLRIARRARRRHAKYCALMMTLEETPKSRLPVRIKDQVTTGVSTSKQNMGHSYEYKPLNLPKGCVIPVRIRQHMQIKNATNNVTLLQIIDHCKVVPYRLEDIDTSASRDYFIEQFQKSQLFKQRYRKKKSRDSSWTLGLTPFQCWVIENVGAAVTNTAEMSDTPKRRLTNTVSKISCWRRHGPASR